MDPTISALMAKAEGIIDNFFTQLRDEQKVALRTLVPEVGTNKGLVGYNKPTDAKEVFRLRRGAHIPFPNDRFKQCVLSCFDTLEHVMDCCMEVVITSLGSSYEHFLESSIDRHTYYHLKKKHLPIDHSPDLSISTCPFDLFRYNNATESQSANCFEHIDPGFMTIVPCSSTAGLSIFDSQTGIWQALEHWLAPHEHFIVFNGKMLQGISDNIYPSAAHRVDKAATRRISMVYELRSQPTFVPDPL
eukprot:GILK01012932.1.p1 GENE.GILK01012932.1~~GILK01012932.1.p1  ORF type:complete len:286 (+),score=29.60 GILK01012932.1:121-858(+)